MKQEIAMSVIGGDEERFSTDIYEATLALWNRMHRHGVSSLRLSEREQKASSKHFLQRLKDIGQRMHGHFLPAAAHEHVLEKPFCVYVDSLLGRSYVWYQAHLRGKRVVHEGLRIVSVPSPYGRYYVGVDDSLVAKRIFGKPSVMIVKSHCITRLQERLGLPEDEALAQVFGTLFRHATMIPDVGEKSVPFGDHNGSIKAKTADITIDEGQELIHLKSFFMTICYTYYYEEWEQKHAI